VEIDSSTGLLKTYRIDGVDYVKNGFELVSFDDNEDPWAMGADQRRRVGVNERPFALSSAPDGVFKGMKNVQITEDGDVYLGVEAFFEQDSTRARIAYKIYKNNDDIDVDVNVYMGDINRIVKLKLPLLASGELVGQTAFGTKRLFTDARENVAHRFIAIKGEGKCPVLMNRDVYGSHYENGALYMSLVRGVTYCAHPIIDRPIVPSDKFTKKIDQGENSFSFRLTVAKHTEIERKTREFTQKPYALNVFPVPTEKKARGAFDARIEDETISCVAIKKADDREAVIFRLLNNTDECVNSAILVNGERLLLSFGKFEVKTVLWENGKLWESAELII
jgi:alpha-mannosidase